MKILIQFPPESYVISTINHYSADEKNKAQRGSLSGVDFLNELVAAKMKIAGNQKFKNDGVSAESIYIGGG